MLIHPLEEKEVKKGGIIIPDTAREKPRKVTLQPSALTGMVILHCDRYGRRRKCSKAKGADEAIVVN